MLIFGDGLKEVSGCVPGGGGSPMWNRPLKRDRLKKKKKRKKENLTSVSLRVILCFFAEP